MSKLGLEIEDIEETPIEKKKVDKISQDHLYNLLISRELSWQEIIYDLINTEQLDPWDVDIVLLAQRYLDKIRELEEISFFISSKVLLAASFLLRIKSEILLNEHIRSIDEILFGKKEEKLKKIEEIDFDGVPELVLKTPLPRFKKVTLNELMLALNKAMSTEQRRIKREILIKQRHKLAEIVLPKPVESITERIKTIYDSIHTFFISEQRKMSFTHLAGEDKEQRLLTFLPLLHLGNQQKVWLEQEKHFEEIYIWLRKHKVTEERIARLEEAILRKEIELEIDGMKEEFGKEDLSNLGLIFEDIIKKNS
ncbi:hypothetical protein COV15_02500 [Candidatus Woesearchaeota archaeon CG10_big_fil_rev_8_21_14_0_10_34_12]|nr:MAG: hypothetical protein COV15_02500 [Candidatus Woesearchaeota archaeon CG10_big_fil_rev_8_21_14_0_10_34_12]